MLEGQKKTEALTIKQIEYIKNHAVLGMTKQEAKVKAGYSPTTSTHQLERSEAVQNAMQKALDRRGLSEDFLAKKIAQGLNAFDKHFYSFEGKVIDEKISPDFATREKYLRTALELKGYIRVNQDVNLNLGVISLSQERQDQEWNKPEDQITQIPDINNVEDSKG